MADELLTKLMDQSDDFDDTIGGDEEEEELETEEVEEADADAAEEEEEDGVADDGLGM